MIKNRNVVETLSEHPFLAGFRPAHVERLATLAHEVCFERGQVIFREGDDSSFFYLLIAGKVALEVTALGKTLRVQTLREGEELGWSSIMETRTKHFQARALSAVRTLAFDGTSLGTACEEDCSFGYAMTRRLLTVVAGRLQAFRIQLLDLYSPEGPKSS